MSTLVEEMVLPAAQQAPPSETGQRVILRGVSWETYERLLADFEDRHAVHFTFDRGALEIMVLSTKHEEPNRTLALLVEVLAEELGIDVRRLGSTTFQREDLLKGFEPDSCFYIQSLDRIGDKTEIDLTIDPPPDLVIEIDISHPSLDKLPLYAAVGVPEVWRYDGSRVQFFKLENEQYVEVEQSLALARLTSTVATQFLKDSMKLKSTAWLRRVREWARQQAGADNPSR
jgi:Uma2 family endonuclease